MTTLIIMAHHDPEARLRVHVLRTVERLASEADRFVLVTTSGIDLADQEDLPDRVELQHRRGPNGRFASYQFGLELVTDFADFDTLLLVDDSFVGPTIPLAEIVHGDWTRAYDVVPMTSSMAPRWHSQPYFLAFKAPVLRSRAFRRFWDGFDPSAEKADSVDSVVDLEKELTASGFRVGAYYRPDPAEHELASRRGRWAHRLRLDDRMAEAHVRWDPSVALADALLDDDRLPLLRTATLISNPYVLDGDDVLDAAESRHPVVFAGVGQSLGTAPRSRRPEARPASKNEARAAEVAYRTTSR